MGKTVGKTEWRGAMGRLVFSHLCGYTEPIGPNLGGAKEGKEELKFQGGTLKILKFLSTQSLQKNFKQTNR